MKVKIAVVGVLAMVMSTVGVGCTSESDAQYYGRGLIALILLGLCNSGGPCIVPGDPV